MPINIVFGESFPLLRFQLSAGSGLHTAFESRGQVPGQKSPSHTPHREWRGRADKPQRFLHRRPRLLTRPQRAASRSFGVFLNSRLGPPRRCTATLGPASMLNRHGCIAITARTLSKLVEPVASSFGRWKSRSFFIIVHGCEREETEMKVHTQSRMHLAPSRGTTLPFRDRQYSNIVPTRHLRIDYNDNVHATSSEMWSA